MKLSIITLTYNNLEYTKKYIKSLYENTKDFELILVDNGSTDGTVEYFKSLPYDNIKFIFNDENLGFSKGNNQAIELAEGEYIGFLNNDILLPPNWFDGVEYVFNNESDAAFVSPFHLNPAHYNVNAKNYLKYFNKMKKYCDYRKSYHECVFSCVITPKNIIDKIGGFDEAYTPALCEDDDIKYRVIETGYNIYVSYKSCFFHYYSKTAKHFTNTLEKNKQYLYEKYPYGFYVHCLLEEYWNFLLLKKTLWFQVYKFCQRVERFYNNQIKRRFVRFFYGYPVEYAWSSEFLEYFNKNDMDKKINLLKFDTDKISQEYVDFFMKLSKFWNGKYSKNIWSKYDLKLFKQYKKYLKTFKQLYPNIATFNPFIFFNQYGLKDLPKEVYNKIDGRTIIDIGGYNGDTAIMFNGIFPNSKILVYEPLSVHINKLKTILKLNNFNNKIIPIQKGLGDKDEIIDINFIETETCKITTLNKELFEKSEDIGLIKMDVEGFETAVVNGASEVIKKHKPVLAIAIYHRPEDFFDMKEKIKIINSNYRFMIRRSEAIVPQADLVLIAY